MNVPLLIVEKTTKASPVIYQMRCLLLFIIQERGNLLHGGWEHSLVLRASKEARRIGPGLVAVPRICWRRHVRCKKRCAA